MRETLGYLASVVGSAVSILFDIAAAGALLFGAYALYMYLAHHHIIIL